MKVASAILFFLKLSLSAFTEEEVVVIPYSGKKIDKEIFQGRSSSSGSSASSKN